MVHTNIGIFFSVDVMHTSVTLCWEVLPHSSHEIVCWCTLNDCLWDN